MSSNLTKLANHILTNEFMNEATSTALKAIGKQIRLHSIADDSRSVTFVVELKQDDCVDVYVNNITSTFLILTAVKGSLMTTLWNTCARFDDEYVLYSHESYITLGKTAVRSSVLWRVTGVDALNSKITSGEVDWFKLRDLQLDMKVNTVGVLAFSKLMGRMLLSFPGFHKKGKYFAAMPASFMFNYLMVVSSCPFEVSVLNLLNLLNSECVAVDGAAQKTLLSDLMHSDGRGAWVLNYFPFCLGDGSKALCSKFHHCMTTPDNFHNHPHSRNSPSRDPEKLTVHAGTTYNEAAVRVVELREHSLGVGGLVAVVERVHHRKWNESSRYVVLDAFQLSRMARYRGSVPAEEDSRIQILDFNDWAMKVRVHNSTLPAGAAERSLDLLNTAQWGVPLRDKKHNAAVQKLLASCSSTTGEVRESNIGVGNHCIGLPGVNSSTAAQKPRLILHALPSFHSVAVQDHDFSSENRAPTRTKHQAAQDRLSVLRFDVTQVPGINYSISSFHPVSQPQSNPLPPDDVRGLVGGDSLLPSKVSTDHHMNTKSVPARPRRKKAAKVEHLTVAVPLTTPSPGPQPLSIAAAAIEAANAIGNTSRKKSVSSAPLGTKAVGSGVVRNSSRSKTLQAESKTLPSPPSPPSPGWSAQLSAATAAVVAANAAVPLVVSSTATLETVTVLTTNETQHSQSQSQSQSQTSSSQVKQGREEVVEPASQEKVDTSHVESAPVTASTTTVTVPAVQQSRRRRFNGTNALPSTLLSTLFSSHPSLPANTSSDGEYEIVPAAAQELTALDALHVPSKQDETSLPPLLQERLRHLQQRFTPPPPAPKLMRRYQNDTSTARLHNFTGGQHAHSTSGMKLTSSPTRTRRERCYHAPAGSPETKEARAAVAFPPPSAVHHTPSSAAESSPPAQQGSKRKHILYSNAVVHQRKRSSQTKEAAPTTMGAQTKPFTSQQGGGGDTQRGSGLESGAESDDLSIGLLGNSNTPRTRSSVAALSKW